jgi:hypothetical protein
MPTCAPLELCSPSHVLIPCQKSYRHKTAIRWSTATFRSLNARCHSRSQLIPLWRYWLCRHRGVFTSTKEGRANRRGQLGRNVGTNEMLVDWYPLNPNQEPDGSPRSHKSAHIRTGHFYAVRCGKRKSQMKVEWFRPTVVRPDLPFSEKKPDMPVVSPDTQFVPQSLWAMRRSPVLRSTRETHSLLIERTDALQV